MIEQFIPVRCFRFLHISPKILFFRVCLLQITGKTVKCLLLQALYTDPLSDEEPRLVAVKQLKQLKCDSRSVARVLDEMRSEMDIMKSLQHENIVETVGIVLDPMPLLVMEFVQNGALSSYLRSHPDLCTSQLLQFATDVASGMAYLQVRYY